MLDHFVELARGWLAAGDATDEVLVRLRERGVTKFDSIRVLTAATGMSQSEVNRLVHCSPTWADRRVADEQFEDMIWRSLFIEFVLGGLEITEPDDWVAECRDRQQRATAQMRDVAAGLPGAALTQYDEAMAEGQFGAAFAALVAVVEQHGGDLHWPALEITAQTLCLNECFDEVEEPSDDEADDVRAARFVRRRANSIG